MTDVKIDHDDSRGRKVLEIIPGQTMAEISPSGIVAHQHDGREAVIQLARELHYSAGRRSVERIDKLDLLCWKAKGFGKESRSHTGSHRGACVDGFGDEAALLKGSFHDGCSFSPALVQRAVNVTQLGKFPGRLGVAG